MEETSSQAAPSEEPFDTRGVLILGAGFSRAVSDRLPLVDELGNSCLVDLSLGDDPRVPSGGFSGGSLVDHADQRLTAGLARMGHTGLDTSTVAPGARAHHDQLGAVR